MKGWFITGVVVTIFYFVFGIAQLGAGRPLFVWSLLVAIIALIGIKKSLPEFKKAISKRVDKMIKNGLREEVKELVKKCGWTTVLKNAIGYQEFKEKNPINKIKLHTLQFAKRQMTWFKREKRIYWIETYSEAEKLVRKFLKK